MNKKEKERFDNMNEERNKLISRQNIARTKGDLKTVKMISQKLRKLLACINCKTSNHWTRWTGQPAPHTTSQEILNGTEIRAIRHRYKRKDLGY